MCPNPPKPTTPTFLPLPTPQCRSGEYVVIPAHNSGAVPARSRFGGTRKTKCSSTTTRSEYPPYVTPPRCLSSELKVSVTFGQNCSSPALHCGQVRSESTM